MIKNLFTKLADYWRIIHPSAVDYPRWLQTCLWCTFLFLIALIAMGANFPTGLLSPNFFTTNSAPVILGTNQVMVTTNPATGQVLIGPLTPITTSASNAAQAIANNTSNVLQAASASNDNITSNAVLNATQPTNNVLTRLAGNAANTVTQVTAQFQTTSGTLAGASGSIWTNFSVAEAVGGSTPAFAVNNTNGVAQFQIPSNASGVFFLGTNANGQTVVSNSPGAAAIIVSNSPLSALYQVARGIGIGTNLPQGTLHAVSRVASSTGIPMIAEGTNGGITLGTAIELLRLVNVSTNNNTFAKINFDSIDTSGTIKILGSIAVQCRDHTVGAGTGDVVIATAAGANATEKVRVLATGEFGVGTALPLALIHASNSVAEPKLQLNQNSGLTNDIAQFYFGNTLIASAKTNSFRVDGTLYAATNTAPYFVTNFSTLLVTNLSLPQRALLFVQLAFDDVTGGIPSCTVVATNIISTNNFGTIAPNLTGLTLVGTVSITNHYMYVLDTNQVIKFTDTSSGGAAVRMVQSMLFAH